MSQVVKQLKETKQQPKKGNTFRELLACCDTDIQKLHTCKCKNEGKTNMAITQCLLSALLKRNQTLEKKAQPLMDKVCPDQHFASTTALH